MYTSRSLSAYTDIQYRALGELGGKCCRNFYVCMDKRVLLWDIDDAFLNGIGSYL